MANLILDHVFCFCDSWAGPEQRTAERAGFVVTKERRHEGQGTSNRCIMLEENYIEFIFVDSETDARRNPVRADRRAKWKKTGACPFGIGLRGSLEEADQRHFWEYKPRYWPSGRIYIHKSNEQNPEWPMIFLLAPAVRPGDRPDIDRKLLRHKTNSTAIHSVHIEAPALLWPLASQVEGLSVSSAERPTLTVKVDGNFGSEIHFNERFTMTRWKRD